MGARALSHRIQECLVAGDHGELADQEIDQADLVPRQRQQAWVAVVFEGELPVRGGEVVPRQALSWQSARPGKTEKDLRPGR